jgi:hypothetical protein
MAMTVRPRASVVELGNTVVDPQARGAGLAWEIGAELSSWCRELGYQGFLHYPTTDHHIMQRQSVKAGFETGLMLGYIPAETHGQVGDGSGARKRQAATIVYEPYAAGAPFDAYLPEDYAEIVRDLAKPTGLPRKWRASTAAPNSAGACSLRQHRKRGLARLEVDAIGRTTPEGLDQLQASGAPCQQLDLRLADPAIGAGVRAAGARGFRFCGWLPGFSASDVLRMQKLDEAATDLQPGLANPVARRLLEVYLTSA